MSAQPAPAPAPAAPACTAPASTAQDYAGLLDDIINVGAQLVRDLRDLPEKLGQDVARDYDLLTRSIRRSILLVRKLAEAPEPAPTPDPTAHRTAARKRIIRKVQDAIQHRARGPDADNLESEFLERLDSPDLEDDIDTRPVPEIIADICRDLGLDPSFDPSRWKRRTPDDVQALGALAAKPPAEPDVEQPEAELPRSARPHAPVLASVPDHSDDGLPDDPAAAIFRYEALARDQR